MTVNESSEALGFAALSGVQGSAFYLISSGSSEETGSANMKRSQQRMAPIRR
jgi:hypothetical protein